MMESNSSLERNERRSVLISTVGVPLGAASKASTLPQITALSPGERVSRDRAFSSGRGTGEGSVPLVFARLTASEETSYPLALKSGIESIRLAQRADWGKRAPQFVLWHRHSCLCQTVKVRAQARVPVPPGQWAAAARVAQTCRFSACLRPVDSEGRIHADNDRRHVCATRRLRHPPIHRQNFSSFGGAFWRWREHLRYLIFQIAGAWPFWPLRALRI
jgi:hypothetical protein